MFKTGGVILGLCCFLLSSTSVIAGGYDLKLFSPDGLRLPEPSSDELASAIPLEPYLATLCDEVPDAYCIRYQLSVQEPTDEFIVRAAFEAALSIWKSVESFDGVARRQVNIDSVYEGLSDSNLIPYERDPDTDEILSDEFGNKIIDGDFIVSIDPPAEILDYFDDHPEEYSTAIQYLVPNIDDGLAEIRWGGIYINPDFLPAPYGECTGDNCILMSSNGNLSLRAIFTFELGRSFLGIGASGLKASLMYPIQDRDQPKSFIQLTDDDLIWASAKYPSPEVEISYSVIRGKILNGLNGEIWTAGAHVSALKKEKLDEFAQTLNQNLFVAGALVGPDGEFELRLPEGDYIVIAESLDGAVLSPGLFDEFTSAMAEGIPFEPDFYDGADRESNKEAAEYSPQSIFFAATLQSNLEQANENLELYTNVQDAEEQFFALGADFEVLSDYEFEDLSELINDFLSEDNRQALAGPPSKACSLRHGASDKSFLTILILGLFLGLCLSFRSRSDLKAE